MALSEVQESWIRWAVDAYNQQQEAYQRFEDYYEGDHQLTFSTAVWKDVFGDTFKEFSDNWCEVVVDAKAERLKIIGWDSEDDKAASTLAEDIWDRNNLTIEEQDLYVATFVKGDGYLMAWENPDREGEAEIYFNDALDVNIHYDPARRRKAIRASKKWEDERAQLHLRLYYPDRTEQYLIPNQDKAKAAQWMGFQVPGEMLPEGWVREGADIPNRWEQLPVFHFRNKSGSSSHGRSELKQVIPMQNSVNKLLMDLMVGSEFGSFRQKGIAGPQPPDGGWKSGPNRVWATSNPDTKFFEFGQIDLESAVRAVEMVVGHIAKITRTPMHYLRPSGDMPSGEALKTAESGLVQTVKNRQEAWGYGSWSQAMSFAVEIERGKPPKSPVYPVWRAAESRHDLEQAQTAQLKSVLGIPLKQLWTEHFNYSKEQVEEFEKDNLAIAATIMAQVIVQAGQLPPGVGKIDLDPQQIIELLRAGGNGGGGLNLSQILAGLPKSITSQTTAGEATTKPQPGTAPPASPTRRSSGFRD